VCFLWFFSANVTADGNYLKYITVIIIIIIIITAITTTATIKYMVK